MSRADGTLELDGDEDGLRTAVVGFPWTSPAGYEVAVRLCTALEAMPIENGHPEWSDDDGPYVPVAHLVLPAQDAYSSARQACGGNLWFSPARCLAAFRPFGGLYRARLAVYGPMAALRRSRNDVPATEPSSADAIPD